MSINKLKVTSNINTENTVFIKVPKSFEWVIEQQLEWFKEHITGEITLIYKDGGVTAVKPCPYLKPNK